jgi:hypothetical protein
MTSIKSRIKTKEMNQRLNSLYTKRISIIIVFLVTIVTAGNLFATGSENTKLKAYTAPAGAILNNDFKVRVRIPGQNWQSLPTYLVKVDQVKGVNHHVENASMSYFDFSGVVELDVTFKGPVQSARIRPLSYSINSEIHGNTIHFKLVKPANLSLEVNGDIFHNLHLFANPVEAFIPDPKDTSVLFFGPGIHEVPGGILEVPSGKTVYLAGGAVLKAQVLL